jgi:hypothetical protein
MSLCSLRTWCNCGGISSVVVGGALSMTVVRHRSDKTLCCFMIRDLEIMRLTKTEKDRWMDRLCTGFSF